MSIKAEIAIVNSTTAIVLNGAQHNSLLKLTPKLTLKLLPKAGQLYKGYLK